MRLPSRCIRLRSTRRGPATWDMERYPVPRYCGSYRTRYRRKRTLTRLEKSRQTSGGETFADDGAVAGLAN